MVKYYTQSMQVLLSHLQKHDQIIQIDQVVDEIQLTHIILHKSLEGSRGITKSKRHFIALRNPRLPKVKAVYCFDSSSILICQNPDFRSRQEK